MDTSKQHRYFHISSKFIGKTATFIPRIPNEDGRADGEDDKIKRICVAPTVAGCMRATYTYAGEQFFIYATNRLSNRYVTNWRTLVKDNLVPDAAKTHECWIKRTAKLHLIALVKARFDPEEEIRQSYWRKIVPNPSIDT